MDTVEHCKQVIHEGMVGTGACVRYAIAHDQL